MVYNIMKTIILLLLISLTLSGNFTFVKHPLTGAARCLDGTQAGFYIEQGTQTDKFVIYFQGGGLCLGDTQAATIASCNSRSSTYLGSSSTYLDSRSFDTYGMISSLPTNPFHTWTRVYFPYCDGSIHQGSKTDPVTSATGKQLYFRGANNTLANFDYLDTNYQLFAAKKIIVVGTSAGGLAATIWSNYVHDRATNPSGVIVIPDSGMFLTGIPGFLNGKTMVDYVNNLITLVNTESPIPMKQCVAVYPNQMDCFQSGNLAAFIKPKMFVMQSQYDAWGLKNIVQLSCIPAGDAVDLSTCTAAQMVAAENFRTKINEGIKNLTNVAHIGAWTISCSQHVFIDTMDYVLSKNYKVPALWGNTILQAILSFISGRKKAQIDPVAWPLNKKCSGKP